MLAAAVLAARVAGAHAATYLGAAGTATAAVRRAGTAALYGAAVRIRRKVHSQAGPLCLYNTHYMKTFALHNKLKLL